MNQFSFALAVSLVLIGCSGKDRDTGDRAADAMPAANIEAGKSLAERECKGCHGLDGKSGAPGIPNLAAQDEAYLLASIKAYRTGTRTHAALRDMATRLSEDQLRNVVGFYARLPPIQSKAEDGTQRFLPYENGRAIAAECARCHGSDGNSTTPGVPSLAGQQPHYLVVAAHEYLNGVRKTDPMHALLRRLGKLDVESAALYFASQDPVQRSAPPFGDPAAGEPLTAVCGGCHGSRGASSDAATPNLAGQDPRYLVDAIKAYRKSRRHAGMAAYVGDLSQHDIENIAAFYAVQESGPAEKGQTLVQELIEKCDHCHGDHVGTAAMAIPKISGQDKDYLIMALRAYRDDRRKSSMMHNMSLPYSDSVIESVASYYSSQPAR